MLRASARVLSKATIAGAIGLAALLGSATPASAQIVHGLQISAGAFVPHGYDSRGSGDTLVGNLDDLDFRGCEVDPITSCIHRFNGANISGEWVVGVGDHVEFGAGLGFYSRTVHSYYRDYTFPDQTDINQDLQLRIVPVTGVVRFLAGHPGPFQPYVGVGVSALNYRYSETGTFIDFTQLDATGAFVTYPEHYVATGTAFGPVVLAGFRAPVKGDIWAFTTEWRYQAGSGSTGGPTSGFVGPRIDLGGNSINFGVLVRF